MKSSSGDIGTFGFSSAILDFRLPLIEYTGLISALPDLRNIVFAWEIAILSSLEAATATSGLSAAILDFRISLTPKSVKNSV